MTAGLAYWGPHLPDAAGSRYFFGPDFPDDSFDPSLVAAAGPSTAATLALSIASGCQVHLAWDGSMFKAEYGNEQRSANLDLPKETYVGQAYLVGDSVRLTRIALARYAALGNPFLLGLPFEAVPATAAVKVLTVTSTALLDWAVPGQRVICIASDESSSVVCVVQSTTATTITVDVAPGLPGTFLVMPGVAVLLDPKQGFVRYAKGGALEQWQINARAARFGYESAPARIASVPLTGFTPGALNGATVYFTTPGAIGNGASLTLIGDSAPAHGFITVVGQAVTFHFKPGTTRVSDLLPMIGAANLGLTGSLVVSTLLQAPLDEFGPAALAGGFDKTWGTMGAGATVTTYSGHPIWDRGLQGESVTDSLQTLADVEDLGALPFVTGVTAVPDWGRQILHSRSRPADRQWLKAFLFAVRGSQRAFWLPTWRADLQAVSLVPGTLTITSTLSDLFAWYPTLRTQVQVVASDGTILWLQVDGVTDNGNGTLSLIIESASSPAYNAGGGGAAISSFALVSWIDLCRFEAQGFSITWTGHVFEFSANARAVQS